MSLTQFKKRGAVEWLVALIAFGAQAMLLLVPSQPRTQQENLGDFKLVYASMAALAQSGQAYNVNALAQVNRDNGVVVPASWYGHSPVYPLFTLLALSPALLLPMVPAAFLWGAISYIAFAAASVRLARYADAHFGLPLWLRVLLICLISASPLVSFGLELANLSVVAACLCIYATTADPERGMWLPAAALVGALILKPHLAFWVVLGLALLPRRTPSGNERGIAVRGIGLFSVSLIFTAVYLGAKHQLFTLLKDYVAMLRAEASSGRMNVHTRGIIMIPAQVTSLGSLLGYSPISDGALLWIQVILLLPLFLWLVRLSISMDSDRKSILISAWILFGLLVTYHSAHDGVALFLMLPWVLERLWRRWNDGAAWTVLVLYAFFSIDVPPVSYHWMSEFPPLHAIAIFLMFRQVALATLLLALTLTFILTQARQSGSTARTMKSSAENVACKTELTHLVL